MTGVAERPGATPSALIVANGDDVYEDLFTASLELQAIASASGLAARVSFGMARAVEESPDVVVLYTATGEFSAAQQHRLADAVAGGIGLLAVHASNVLPGDPTSTESTGVAFDLIGSRYLSHGPTPHEDRFMVRVANEHPVTEGVADFDITHEHYELELADADRETVLAWREPGETPVEARREPSATPGEPGEARREPLLHVHERGAGRVAYLQLGHDMRAFGEPSVRRLIGNALTWLSATRHDAAHSGSIEALHAERNAG